MEFQKFPCAKIPRNSGEKLLGIIKNTKTTVPDKASYIRGWIQMVMAPNDLFSWNNKYNKYVQWIQYHRHIHLFLPGCALYLLCACWHLEAMKGSSSSTSCRLLILSRLFLSLIWAQLMLPVPASGTRLPLPQNGAPIHRVRAHSLTGIRNNYCTLETWKHIDMGIERWRPGDMETWRHVDLETWRPRDMETWRHGDLETWRPGDMETWRHGDLETWRPGDMETLRPGDL